MAVSSNAAFAHDDDHDDDHDKKDKSGYHHDRFNKRDAERITRACHDAAEYVNDEHPDLIGFRPMSGRGIWWCAVSNREGDLLSVRASDTLGTPKNPMGSDAARLSIRIAIAKTWTASFSNNELAVDSRAVGLNSRIDQKTPLTDASGDNSGSAPLWGVWATNLFRSFPGKTGIKMGERHYGVVPFAGGVPVYDCYSHKLVAHAGASGDTVDSDAMVIEKAVNMAGFCLTPTQHLD